MNSASSCTIQVGADRAGVVGTTFNISIASAATMAPAEPAGQGRRPCYPSPVRHCPAVSFARPSAIAQDAATSEFLGMPAAAIRSAVVDLVLPPERIGLAIAALLDGRQHDEAHRHGALALP